MQLLALSKRFPLLSCADAGAAINKIVMNPQVAANRIIDFRFLCLMLMRTMTCRFLLESLSFHSVDVEAAQYIFIDHNIRSSP